MNRKEEPGFRARLVTLSALTAERVAAGDKLSFGSRKTAAV